MVEQIGLPVPATPILLAAGALAATGHLNYPLGLAVAVAASVIADLIWYELGRRSGSSILSLLCRVSLEPDSCVRRTEEIFVRHGGGSLLYAKFVPGLNTAAPPLAGLFRMHLGRFLFLDSLGAILWVGAFTGLGYVFNHELEAIAIPALRLGTWLLALLVGGLGIYILWKYLERRRFLSRLDIARITPEELQRKISAGEAPLMIDVRMSHMPGPAIPGAIRLVPEDVESSLQNISAEREIVLYCD